MCKFGLMTGPSEGHMTQPKRKRSWKDMLVRRHEDSARLVKAQHEQAVRIGQNYIERFERGSARRICEEVCIKYDMTFEFAISDVFLKPAVRARQEMMYRLRHETKLSFPQIGRILKRDHSSIIAGILSYGRRHVADKEELPPMSAEARRIVTETCDAHGMERRLIGYIDKDEVNVVCRWHIAFRLSTELGLSSAEIGRIVNRGPESVALSIKKFRSRLDAHESKLQGAKHGNQSRNPMVSATAGGAQLGI